MFATGLLLLAGVAVGLYALTRLELPPPPPLSQTTYVYDSQGHVLTSYRVENRTDVPLSAIPPVLTGAVISTEDRHFYSEGAVNPLDILRAFVSDVRGTGSLQGGSTITQQYVKQTYLSSRRTLTRKIEEAALAVKLGRVDSKDEILDDYLNTIYFGRDAYGVQAASEAYFGVPVQRVDLADAALLAGLIREPDLADPAVDAPLARLNQGDTLRAMVRDHRITPAQADAVIATPMSRYVLAPARSALEGTNQIPGDAYYLQAVRDELLARLPASEVDGGGLRVTTTLDPTLQEEAFDAVYGSGPHALDPAGGTPAGALVSVDDEGDVRAMVGGAGYDSDYAGSQVDLALGGADGGGGSGRQAGSTFKAFMLAYLVKSGYSVESTFPAPPEIVIPHGNSNGTPWEIGNFEHEAGSPETSVVTATAESINTVYAQIIDRLGAQNLTATAEEMGIHASELPPAPGYPSEVLGTPSVSPLEMAAAYATFAHGGVFTSPVLITRVTTASGQVVPWPARTTRQVLTPDQDEVVDYVLQQVVLDGTGVRAGDVGSEVAGKTGTTEDSADAWFVGYTPHLTTAVWIGHPSSEIPMPSEQGGDTPAELWHDYMTAALASEPDLAGDFPSVYSFYGRTLLPPAAGTVSYPEGLGTTTTTAAPATTTPSTTTATTTATPAPTPTSAPAPTTGTTTPATTATTRPASVTTTTVRTTPSSAPATTAAAAGSSAGEPAGAAPTDEPDG